MKKLFVFVLIAAFSFGLIGVQKTFAQVNCQFTIKWHNNNCNCGTITDKILVWYLWDFSVTPALLIDHGTEHPEGNEFEYQEDQNIDVDCYDCYYLVGTITYYDSGGSCCTGTNSVYLSGTELYNGTATLDIIMN